MVVTVLRLGWNPRASTSNLIDRLFRRRAAAQEAAGPPPPLPSRPIKLQVGATLAS